MIIVQSAKIVEANAQNHNCRVSSDSLAEVPVLGLCVSQPPGVAVESISVVTCGLECVGRKRDADLTPVSVPSSLSSFRPAERNLGLARLLVSTHRSANQNLFLGCFQSSEGMV